MAKYPAHAQDPYIDPHSGILRNRLGITDPAKLDEAETALSVIRSYEMARNPVPGRFDLAHLQAIHHRLFADVYDWAGQLRTVDISKGNTRFASHEQIESYAPEIIRPLHREQLLRGLDVDTFCQRAGFYLGELNVLHPFREGNGRSTREFIGHVARDAGYVIDWGGMARKDMVQAAIDAYEGNSTRLARLIRAHITDLEQEHARDLGRVVAGEKVQFDTPAPGQSYEGLIVGCTERYVVQARGDHMVLHARHALLNSQDLVDGQVMSIRYPHGGVGIVDGGAGHQVEKGTQLEHDRAKGHDLER